MSRRPPGNPQADKFFIERTIPGKCGFKGVLYHFPPAQSPQGDRVFGDMVEDACDEVRLSFPDTEIRVIAYKNVLGYWAARDIVNDKSIYCGTMSLKATKSTIYKYLENEKS